MVLSFEKRKGNKVKKVSAGTYDSEIIDVSFDDSYVDGSVLKVSYKLKDANGNEFSHSEIFHTGYYNDRTREFLNYLEENGIDDQSLDALVGCCEKVTIKKKATRKGTYPTIVEREFTYNPVIEDAMEN